MTIIQLQYLIEVANCGSFSAASEHCFVTQPSLSMQIKSLEEELGVILLDRSKKPVIPTEAGAVVIAQAQETLKAYNTIRESVAELKGENFDINFGSQIRSYVFHPYKLVKDHRTGFEVGNVDAVMDGDLDGFIEAFLKG